VFVDVTAYTPLPQVTWVDASAYAKWAGKWLPTEAETHEGLTYECASYGTRFKVLRGSSWLFRQHYARCAYRSLERPDGDAPQRR